MVLGKEQEPILLLQNGEDRAADAHLGDHKPQSAQTPGRPYTLLFVPEGVYHQSQDRQDQADQQSDDTENHRQNRNHQDSPFKSVIQSRISSKTEALSS